ncbi:uncharacterized protein LOC117294733 [Asterias rubens]|uniref:uncharacterized protein LOC117294733 n=1 Tax=Asterias rubens TaxID=7604 RepID=UPI0014556FDB|nr:uncharacterized protein LOC117294733 [Asterias rubens]
MRQAMNRLGFKNRQARKKRLVTDLDLKKRVRFAKKMTREYPPGARARQRRSEGLNQHCTAKESKVGSGGRVVKAMVVTMHGEGVILCEPYKTMNGAYFVKFVTDKFEALISRAGKGESRLFLQDGDPSQNSRATRDMMTNIKAELLSTPPSSQDLNPIENIFKLVETN